MNHVERFRAAMNFQPVDRLPRWEWAMWWDATIARWHAEGLPKSFAFTDVFEIARYFGLDPYKQFWFSTTEATIEAKQHHIEGIVANMDDYRRVKPRLFPDHSTAIETMRPWRRARRARGGGLGHAGGLLLVPEDADGHGEAQLRVLRPAGAGPRNEPRPDGVQPATHPPDVEGLRAHVHHASGGQ